MRCFNHSEIEAVAVCKSCGRALCHDCITEVGLGCSCKGRCESDVASINDLAERNRTVYQKNSAIYWWSGIVLISFGVLIAGYGTVAAMFSKDLAGSLWTLLYGVLAIASGFGCFVAARRILQK
ncbi:MAG: hypothetical protein NT105_13590 [Verrucomicrobia bacterium]|nr:hypothetical protein [Verrucomicrobiota bacterium]